MILEKSLDYLIVKDLGIYQILTCIKLYKKIYSIAIFNTRLYFDLTFFR